MKPQSIQRILTTEFRKFTDSLPETLREDVIKTAFITGGSIPSLLIGEYVNDYDVYFTVPTATAKIETHYRAMIRELIRNKDHCKIEDLGLGFTKVHYYDEGKELTDDKDIEKSLKNRYYPKFISKNAITLTSRIQLILGFHGTPDEVVGKFDWKHIKSYWTAWNGKLYIHPDTYRLVVDKELIYTGSDYPLSTMFRMKKFLKKGWNISAHEMTLIAMDLQMQDLSDKKTLISQMSGMDPLYIANELQRLSEKDLSILQRRQELERIINEGAGWEYTEDNY